MWLFRECGAPYIFLHSLWNPAIRWRNLEFRLSWGGKAEAIAIKPAPAPSEYCKSDKSYGVVCEENTSDYYTLQQHYKGHTAPAIINL